MTRPRRVQRGAEVALALLAAAAFFALVSVTLILTDADAFAVVIGIACAAAVFALVHWVGPAYAVPCAMAALLAFDWYVIPPVHDHSFPDTANALDLLFYLTIAVLVGELAAYSTRRAVAAEQARAGISDEQAAVRRVAMLVAADSSPSVAYEAVAREIGQVLGVDSTNIARYELDGTGTTLGAWSRTAKAAAVATGASWPTTGESIVGRVKRTREPARIEDYSGLEGDLVPTLRAAGITASVGTPIFVAGRLWGVMIASATEGRTLARDLELRLAGFTQLVVTAISNAETREQLARLADEQATLRHLATLVARGVAPEELFDAVAAEVGRVLGGDVTNVVRFDAETIVSLAMWSATGDAPVLDRPYPAEEWSLSPRVAATGRPARIDDWTGLSGALARFVADELHVKSSVAAPVFADGRVWGALIVHSRQPGPLPADAEGRLAHFAELIATAIANAQARAEVDRLVDEQSTLRRLATLVAAEPATSVVFASVVEEVGGLMGVDAAMVVRFEPGGAATVVAGAEVAGGQVVVDAVRTTGAAARVDADEQPPPGTVGLGGPSVVATPIVVEGEVWGAIVAGAEHGPPVPATSEARVGQFCELMATAILNVQTRAELAASRARIVAATDAERSRVVRDLHDGAQQRLVHTIVTLKLARRAVAGEPEARELVDEALVQAEQATAELRELAHGIMPSVLTRGGLPAGVRALASRTPVPVELSLPAQRLAPSIEASAYFVVAEALTNIAKHAHATRAWVTAAIEDDTLVVEVRDDGRGGARADGTGLVGLADRLAVLEGRLEVAERAGGGTVLRATIPLAGGRTGPEARAGV